MSNDLLRVVFFTEEGSVFGKLHFAALLNLPEVEIAAVVVSPISHTGEQKKILVLPFGIVFVTPPGAVYTPSQASRLR